MEPHELRHTVSVGETLVAIARRYRLTLSQLLSANARYRSNPNGLREGAQLLIPSARLEQSAVRSENDVPKTELLDSESETQAIPDYFSVPQGQLTFDAEGTENRGRYFSRKPHVPNASSGVIIGRGYDLKDRSEQEIFSDLLEARVDLEDARKLSSCRHLSGPKAKKYLQDFGFGRIEISPESQFRLFGLLYEEQVGEFIRLSSKLDVLDKYGHCLWKDLPDVTKDIVVDLCFRGDYTSATRERVQPTLVAASAEELLGVISDQYYWVELRGVPLERFQLRKAYLAQKLHVDRWEERAAG